MPIDLKSLLPVLVPGAIQWVTEQSAHILETGAPLSETGVRLATAVGVARPDLIRVCRVSRLPLPDDEQLRAVALEAGLLGEGVTGVTFGYGIYVREGHVDNRLISHECRHVYQYEMAGSIDAFLPVYLEQIADVGYHDAPFEIDARAHELDVA